VLGLAIGFVGVLGLGLRNASLKPGEHGVSPAWGIAACIAATVCYGLAANYAKQKLGGVPPMAVAAGSQLSATLITLGPALWWWPARNPGALAWVSAAVLAIACTALAYLLYFRLIVHIGPAHAIAVTFLIPGFAAVWGAIFLGERLSAPTLAGCALILLGTALATGLVTPDRFRRAPESARR
jgi:drug/metabolite transporter (DMT)-like permease